jgi:hypothetical protein
MLQNTTTQAHIQHSVTLTIYCVPGDANRKILKNLNYGNKMEELRLEYKT